MSDYAQDEAGEPTRVQTNEDAETRATRRELKQSTINDSNSGAGAATDVGGDKKTDDGPATPATEEETPETKESQEQVVSPKKKRAHDQLDTGNQGEEEDANSVASTDSAKDRASRSEPEKKRPRDDQPISEETKLPTELSSNELTISPTKKDPPQTSASAFSASGFGKLATASSPFSTFGGASGGSAFGARLSPKLSSFASPGSEQAPQPATAPKLSFGAATNASPFAGVPSGANSLGKGFGGSVFGSGISGTKLSSFAAPGAPSLKSDKPAKPFGAPESDAEENEDDGEGDEGSQPEEECAASPEKEAEDHKKVKLQKVEVDDGESGEQTLLSVRAKMYYHDKDEGWKERGAGMLKINAPRPCVDLDDAGAVVPGSFDASSLEPDEDADGEEQGHKVVRLLMRQDQTHRVLLNTAIQASTSFQERTALKSVSIIFTATVDNQARPVTMKMSAANAKLFLNEISIVQRELSGN